MEIRERKLTTFEQKNLESEREENPRHANIIASSQQGAIDDNKAELREKQARFMFHVQFHIGAFCDADGFAQCQAVLQFP